MTPDQPISLAVAVFFSLLALILPLRCAIVPLCIVMCAYPTNVNVPPPQISMTVQRIVGLALLGRCLLSRTVRERFRWSLVDTAGVIYIGLMIAAQVMTVDPSGAANKDTTAAINKQMGFALSAMVPFWCVRLLVVDRETFYTLTRGFLWTSVPLIVLALYQASSGDSPYRTIMSNGILWQEISFQWKEIRPFMGIPMHRASAPFMQCIMFGWFFAIQVPWCTNLYFQRRSLKWWVVPWVLLPLGTIATVSSGPLMMVALSFIFMALFPWRRHWKAIVAVPIIGLVALSAVSNRSLMEIVAGFGLDPVSGYYRVNLLNFIFGKTVSMPGGYFDPMAGHWLAGFGTMPQQFSDYHDLCVQWIFLTVYNGLMGAGGFFLFVGACAWCLRRAKEKAQSLEDRWLCWSMLAILVASMLAMQLVALFAEMFFLYHLFLGLVANTVLICGSGAEQERSVGVLADMDGKRVLLRYRLKPGQRLALVRPGTIQAR